MPTINKGVTLYLKTTIQQAGERVRAIKKIEAGITQAVLYIDAMPPVVITRQGKNKFCNINQANMFMRRV
jgi:hypothetical protein